MTVTSQGRAPIAIIGIGCRFPRADSPESFWRVIRDGVDTITEIPASRFDVSHFYNPRPGTPGKIYANAGGFLDQIDQFDPYFFGISPREAVTMDPQQRLLLEVCWEAMEDAGLRPAQLDGSRVGVFMGMCNADFGHMFCQEPNGFDIYVAGGSAQSVLSGRVSFVLGLQGPSVTLDTACSTSLVTVHLACQSIWSGEASMAQAGGANLILTPHAYLSFAQARMLASDGRCKFGDARADGFVKSDGVGVVLLKPLAQALADNDPVYAVIRGTAVNNDGNSGGLLMTPSQAGQEAAFREAYRTAGISPGEVHYVEAHGTGTSVGDPIELAALGAVLSESRPAGRTCLIGSVKTNIGHTEGAAGVAGLIKVALMLKHRQIAPSLHFETPNPTIPWDTLPLRIPTELQPWPEDGLPARASVSSFGISGTNAHVVVEEAPAAARRPATAAPPDSAFVLPLSGDTPEALRARAASVAAFLRADAPALSLHDICYTASVRRAHYNYRLAAVGASHEELCDQLDAFLNDEARVGLTSGRLIPDRRHKVAFVFSGQGSQWIGMGRDLLASEPVFRETIERCDAAMRQFTDWSLLEQFRADEAASRLDQVDVIQPMIFAAQVALAALWRAWGVEPDAVIGQSMGEVAAAYVAGALRLEDAACIICRRSQIARRSGGRGGMLVVGLSFEEAQQALAGHEQRVSVAVSTSPTTTVLSGDIDALEQIMLGLQHRDVFCRWVKVDYASHSPQVEPLGPALLAALQQVRPRAGDVPIYSTVTDSVADGGDFDAGYWVRNLREPVLFYQGVQRMCADGFTIFIEVSPHPVLLSAIEQSTRHLGHAAALLPSLREGGGRALLLGSLGALHAQGYPVDWGRLYPQGGAVLRLPAYPWQRERFWIETEITGDGHTWHPPTGGRTGGPRKNLLGERVTVATDSGTHVWEMDLSLRTHPFLEDHRVQGAVVLPAAAYVEMALAAAQQVFGPGAHALEQLAFSRALFLPEEGARRVQLVVSTHNLGGASFEFHSFQEGALSPKAAWALHARGVIRPSIAEFAGAARQYDQLEAIHARCHETVERTSFYQAMDERGLQYGPAFQGVRQIWRGNGEGFGELQAPDPIAGQLDDYQIHPALLDACFQVLAASLPRDDPRVGEKDTFLPVGLGRVQLFARPTAEMRGHAFFRPVSDTSGDTLEGDVVLLDAEGQVVLEAQGFLVQRLERGGRSSVSLTDWVYQVQWQAMPLAQPAAELGPLPDEQRRSWLIYADAGGLARRLRAMLEARGEQCVMVVPGAGFVQHDPSLYAIDPANPEDARRLLTALFTPERPAFRGVLHMWGLDAPALEQSDLGAVLEAQRLGVISVLHLVQAIASQLQTAAPQLWLLSSGAQPVGQFSELAVNQAPLTGLARVIAVEHPELRCTQVDLSATPEAELPALFQELWSNDGERQVALREGTRAVARVARPAPELWDQEPRLVSGADPFRLEIDTPGILDNLTLRSVRRRAPGPQEVEIKVCAAGLNFRDVLIAMDLMPPVLKGSLDIGWECVGQIVAVGAGVSNLRVGDDVVAIAPSCFGSYVTTSVNLVAAKPARLTYEDAATIPVTFLTAYYALCYLGRMRKGERVLIHAAAGGVGQAAVQLARRAGAEIFATAGTPAKRALLKSQGVHHVMDSRSLDFADQIMEITGGKGVDLILNSLSGEFIARSLAVLAPMGRFLEIGKVDIVQNNYLRLGQLENNIAFFTIDLGQMFFTHHDLSLGLLREVLAWFETGELEPLPSEVFPISQVTDAFRYMAQGKHTGKVVLTMQEPQVLAAPPRDPVEFRADGTYLITGGAGGLGLAVARYLIDHGARHVALLGRSEAGPAAAAAIAELQADGAQVTLLRADIAQPGQVARALDDIRRALPPLRGIFHSAGVLDDGILLQQSAERFARVLAPKVEGAWNLHEQTREDPIEYFVLFSSVAATLGSPGQGNYVAANAFLDALAHHRRALGLPALAINWGMWGEAGLATREDRSRHLAQQGIMPFTSAQGVALMGLMMTSGLPQAMGIAIDWSRLLSTFNTPLLSLIAAEVARSGGGGARARRKGDGLTREKLAAAEPGQQRALIETFLLEQVARVLRSSPAKLDVHQPLNKLGIDSLMAVELKNRVEIDLEATLPVTALLQGPSIAQLATMVYEQMQGDLAAEAAPVAAEQLPATVDDLSDEEVDALLRQMADEEAKQVAVG